MTDNAMKAWRNLETSIDASSTIKEAVEKLIKQTVKAVRSTVDVEATSELDKFLTKLEANASQFGEILSDKELGE